MNKTEIIAVAKPILFNTEMVRAILEGRKTVTRRVVDKDISNQFDLEADFTPIAYIEQATGDSYEPTYRARYKAGDYLYVRETFSPFDCEYCEGDINGVCSMLPNRNEGCYMYKATHDIWGDAKWHPSIHMPKEAARVYLKVTAVKVERLQDITEEQATSEGCMSWKADCTSVSAIESFKALWDSTLPPNKNKFKCPENEWRTNPWVWVYGKSCLRLGKC